MKQSPELQNTQNKMHPGSLSAKGFLGDDTRNLADILAEDLAALEKLGVNHSIIADRMKYFTASALSSLGSPVIIDEIYQVTVEDFKGTLPCPFNDPFHAGKQNTRVTNLVTGKSLYWSDLNIHMIETHGFYEGKGSFFRVEPVQVVEILGIQ
jgi:hypothetical protein